jgi:hypothetical protein
MSDTDQMNLEGLKKAYELILAGMGSQSELMDSLKQENRSLKKEVERLKEGDFTPEELQNLCHNLQGCGRAEFEEGCRRYQEQLFGPKPNGD